MLNIIKINKIKLYAYHGCLPEEALIGGNYEVNVVLHTDFMEAAQTDDLSKTIDYVLVNQIVKEEMAIRSKLIEHVTKRIHDNLLNKFKSISTLQVKVTKLNPPMNGDVEKVSVIVGNK